MVCAIGETDGSLEAEVKIVDRISVPTKSPEETLPEMIQYFQKWDIKTLGIGCFGPVDLNRNCAEGLAAGPAIEKRWGKPAIELADKPEVWEMEAFYLAQAIANYVLCYSPQKIVLWGGVMHQKQLFAMVREKVKELLNGYVDHEMLDAKIDQYIVAPALGENPGILGAMCLGMLEREG